MKCNNCGKDLPENSGFCPYCMTKFNEPPISKLIKEKKINKKIIIAVSALLVVVISTVFSIAIVKSFTKKEKPANTDEPITISAFDSNSNSSASTENTNTSELKTTPYTAEIKTEKSTNSTIKQTTSKKPSVDKEQIKKAYINKIKSELLLANNCGHSFVYTLYDLNFDGIYELIVSIGNDNNSYDNHCGIEVFTFKNNNAISVGKITQCTDPVAEFYEAKRGGVLYNCNMAAGIINIADNSVVNMFLASSSDFDFDYRIYAGEMLPQSNQLLYGQNRRTLIEEILDKGFDAVQKEYNYFYTLN